MQLKFEGQLLIELGTERFAWIKEILARAGVTVPEAAEELARAVAGSIATFVAERALNADAGTFRERHDRLRALWRLAADSDPPVGQIRVLLQQLPKSELSKIEERALRLWPIVFSDDPAPADSTPGWLQAAPADKFIHMVRLCTSEGGIVAPGRTRGPNLRSRPRLEPIISGVARGTEIPSKAKAESPKDAAIEGRAAANRSGRPTDDASVRLVAMLAIDWANATGQQPASGRSDRKPFGDLVHQVFGWLNLPDATGALRRYWREQERRISKAKDPRF